jgi:hypothetical protein
MESQVVKSGAGSLPWRLTVIWATASKPMSDRALWSKPIIQETPSGQPVSLVNVVKTNSASVFGDVARIVAAIAMNADIDQKTGNSQHGLRNGPFLLRATYEHPHSIYLGYGTRRY